MGIVDNQWLYSAFTVFSAFFDRKQEGAEENNHLMQRLNRANGKWTNN